MNEKITTHEYIALEINRYLAFFFNSLSNFAVRTPELLDGLELDLKPDALTSWRLEPAVPGLLLLETVAELYTDIPLEDFGP